MPSQKNENYKLDENPDLKKKNQAPKTHMFG